MLNQGGKNFERDFPTLTNTQIEGEAMVAQVRPLIEVLAEIPDFRSSQGKRYSLTAVLALAVSAILCGYRSYGAIAEWGQHYGAE